MSEALAWAAGIFDGEGTIVSENGGRRSFCVTIRVGMAHEETIKTLKAIFGFGSVLTYERNGKKRMWFWSATTRQAAIALNLMLPYLVTKKGQARIALKLRETVQTGTTRLTKELREERAMLWQQLRDSR